MQTRNNGQQNSGCKTVPSRHSCFRMKDEPFFSLDTLYNIFFHQWIFIYNWKKTNLSILIRSVLIVATYVSILYLFKGYLYKNDWIDYSLKKHVSDPVTPSVLAIFGFLFWKLSDIRAQKWKYCANLYNKILELKINNSDNSDNEEKIQLLKSALAIDIIDLDLWGNQSFNDFISQEVNILDDEKESLTKKQVLKNLYDKHDELVKKFSNN